MLVPVKLRDTGANHARSDIGSCERWLTPEQRTRRNKAIANREVIHIHLPPEVPDFNWICGTKWVWRVGDEDVLRFLGFLPVEGSVYVCEHEVELD